MPSVETKILLEGGRVLDPAQKLDGPADVLIEDGKIAAAGAPSSLKARAKGARSVSAKGLWVLPGLIDMHVHLREPGRGKDETIRTGTRAAARGGVTSVLAMPNTEPPVDTPARVRWVREKAAEDAAVRVHVCGAVSKGQRGEELAPLGGMVEEGALAFSDDGKAVATAALMRRALEYARTFGVPVIDHCEDPSLSAGASMNEGAASFRLGLAGAPRTSETVVALRDIELARLTRGRVHLAHVSALETVEALRRAKAEGLAVTGEACPHHFTLCEDDMPAYDANFKMNPPLRTRADVEALRRALADGTLDAIATDHAPHAPDRKNLPFADAPFGVIGLETAVPLSLELVRSGVLTPSRWAELWTAGPARLLGLKGLGTLKPGSEADVVLIDPELEWSADRFESKSRNSPFTGRKLKGRAVSAWVKGRLVLDDGHLV